MIAADQPRNRAWSVAGTPISAAITATGIGLPSSVTPSTAPRSRADATSPSTTSTIRGSSAASAA
jgi:hypothetical protein